MKVLVTGASGFTGFHLAEALVKKGYEVYAFVRSSSSVEALEELGVKLCIGDLADAASVEKAVQGKDIVYHIAASYRESGVANQVYYNVNVKGTRAIAEAVLKYNVKRMVHCSTVGVHGHVERPPANEDAPFDPGDEYQETKLEGEKIIQSYIQKGLPAVIFRPVGIYGPGDRRFLKLFRSIQKGTFVMFGKGNVLYHLTYIDDLVKGIMACGEDPRALGRTYIIAGDQATTLDELTKQIASTLKVKNPRIRLPFWLLWSMSVLCEDVCKPLGVNPPLFRRRADFFRKDRAFDSRRIQEELGVRPQVSLHEGLRQTAEWYKEQGLLS